MSETPEQYADRVDRLTNDPRSVELSNRLAPAFTVPRRRRGEALPAWRAWGPYLVAFKWPNDQPDSVLRGYDTRDRAQRDVDRGNRDYDHNPFYVKENEHWANLSWWQRRKL